MWDDFFNRLFHPKAGSLDDIALRLSKLLALLKEIKMNLTDATQALTNVATALDKIAGETTSLVTEVQALKDAAAAGGTTTPAFDAALQAVVDRTASIDALVPDATALAKP
jgi:hypothetical protein